MDVSTTVEIFEVKKKGNIENDLKYPIICKILKQYVKELNISKIDTYNFSSFKKLRRTFVT